MGAKSLVGERIELAGLDISFELAVPGCGVKCAISRTERCQLSRRKLLNLLFDRFDFAHVAPSPKCTSPGIACQPFRDACADKWQGRGKFWPCVGRRQAGKDSQYILPSNSGTCQASNETNPCQLRRTDSCERGRGVGRSRPTTSREILDCKTWPSFFGAN